LRDKRAAEAVEAGLTPVDRVRQRFVEEGSTAEVMRAARSDLGAPLDCINKMVDRSFLPRYMLIYMYIQPVGAATGIIVRTTFWLALT
jgi:hypothetical protein